jgi:hypothetical protein
MLVEYAVLDIDRGHFHLAFVFFDLSDTDDLHSLIP